MNDPLTPGERNEYEADLIAFSDRELDLLGGIEGRNILYAGGTSPLWIEGLAERIGERGSLTVLDLDEDGLAGAEAAFAPDDLPLCPRFVAGDVFDLPFERGSFDLAYSSGLLHELDLRGREGGIAEFLRELDGVVVPGGEIAGSDFVDDVGAAQIEDEAIGAETLRLATGAELFGIGGSARLVGNLEAAFVFYEHSIHPPFEVRHLGKLFLAEPEHVGLDVLGSSAAERIRRRREHLRERVLAGGYTRPATLFFNATRT